MKKLYCLNYECLFRTEIGIFIINKKKYFVCDEKKEEEKNYK